MADGHLRKRAHSNSQKGLKVTKTERKSVQPEMLIRAKARLAHKDATKNFPMKKAQKLAMIH